MIKYARAFLGGYSGIFFLSDYRYGILIFAITLVSPTVALAGVISVAAAYLFARLIKVDQDFLNLGFYTYNPLLVGLSIGYLFRLTPPTILFLAIGGAFTFVLTMALYNIFSTYLRLPVLSLPFVLVSTIAYLASTKYAGLSLATVHPYVGAGLESYLPVWLTGYLKSLGAIFFMPQVIPGLVLALTILAFSRILFLLSLVGYYAGVSFTALMVGSFTPAFADVNHFNSLLIAMAVGGVFLVPSLKSYILALIAVCVSTVFLDSIQIFWSYTRLPVFTLPFNVSTFLFLYVLGLVHYPHLARAPKDTPEETLDFYLWSRRRRRKADTELRTLMLPFAGRWTVWQGFEGQWTHQGMWKYAYDFVITDAQGRTYRNTGNNLTDYYAYHKPVLSPVRGRVVKVVNDLPDNPAGQVDKVNNWGNLVIIQDERGFFVEISHFAQHSIQVTEGAWVEQGAFLGLCGNSGYSAQPHIHIQVQDVGMVGAYTVPFSFVNYANDDAFHMNETPAEGVVVEPLYRERNPDASPLFTPGTVHQYQIWKDGRKIDTLTLTVGVASDGTLYLDSGRGKLYFGQRGPELYFYGLAGRDPYLEKMLLALPRLPLARRENLQWRDSVPTGLAVNGLGKAVVQFLHSFYPDLASPQVSMKYTRRRQIETTVRLPFLRLEKRALVEWDPQAGFETIRVDGLELRRVHQN